MRGRIDRTRAGGTAALVAAALLSPVAVCAAPTPAGTRIENVATLAHDGAQTASNPVVLVVDAVLDVAVAADHDRLAVTPGDAPLAIPFLTTNTGNDTGSFTLAAGADRSATLLGIAVDTDGDGRFDPAKDQRLTGDTIALAAGAAQRVFVLVQSPAAVGVTVSLSATAVRGHGAPGTVLPGAGADGGDAVIGQSGATATARTLLVDGTDAAPRLEKSQSVLGPDGSTRARPGATITYRLDARFAGPARAVTVADAIPTGTRFVPGSITLDGQPLADAIGFDGTTVRVALGDVAAAGVRTIRFQTIIQ